MNFEFQERPDHAMKNQDETFSFIERTNLQKSESIFRLFFLVNSTYFNLFDFENCLF